MVTDIFTIFNPLLGDGVSGFNGNINEQGFNVNGDHYVVILNVLVMEVINKRDRVFDSVLT